MTERRKWWALAACCCGLFMVLLDVTVVSVALPVLQRDLNADFSELQWVVDAYTIALAVLLVTAGRLGDVFGRKKVFVAGLGVFTVGSLLCGLSGGVSLGGVSGVEFLWAARVVQGVGGAMMLPLSLAIVSSTFEGRQRGTAIGIWGGVSGLATALGPLVGGLMVEKVSWQSIFYLNIPIGVAGIALAAWAVRESRDERAGGSVDLFGLATISAGVFCLVLALIQGEDRGWGSAHVLTLFAVAAAALALFVVGELRIENPMVDPRLFRNKSFTGSCITAFSLSAGLYSILFFLTLYLQNSLGFDALETGLRLLPLSGLLLLIAPAAGNLTGRIGPRPVLFSGMALLAVAVFLMGRISPEGGPSEWVVLLPAFVLAGLGSGLVNPPISTVAVGTVEPGRAGMASGISNICRQVGIAFGIALWGAVLTGRYDHYVQDRIGALDAPQMTDGIERRIADGLQSAGTMAGSTGLEGAPASLRSMPSFPAIQDVARASFIDGTVDIFRLSAIVLAVGALAALILVRNSAPVGPSGGERPSETPGKKATDKTVFGSK